tara:strand:+ start:751 stop:924 length:174 start_codon:yes stop_codon:yes gene_type:complete
VHLTSAPMIFYDIFAFDAHSSLTHLDILLIKQVAYTNEKLTEEKPKHNKAKPAKEKI